MTRPPSSTDNAEALNACPHLENQAMTMPDERMLARRSGRETPNEVAGDNSLPAATRQRTQSVSQQ